MKKHDSRLGVTWSCESTESLPAELLAVQVNWPASTSDTLHTSRIDCTKVIPPSTSSMEVMVKRTSLDARAERFPTELDQVMTGTSSVLYATHVNTAVELSTTVESDGRITITGAVTAHAYISAEYISA